MSILILGAAIAAALSDNRVSPMGMILPSVFPLPPAVAWKAPFDLRVERVPVYSGRFPKTPDPRDDC
jgi:hypothetical protein